MEKLLIFFIGFLPGVFYLWYFYKKDKYEPEPVRLIIKTYFMGMLAAIPISFLEAPFAFSGFILIVIAAPVIEEYGKYFVVKRKIYQNVEFDEPMDGIIYAVSAALGIAMLFHAGFNFLLVSIPVASIGVFVLVPIMWKVVHNRIKTALSISPYKENS